MSDHELGTLWAELESLIPQGPSRRADTILKLLDERVRQMEAAGHPDAAEKRSWLCFSTGVLADIGGKFDDAVAALRAGIEPGRRALEAKPDDPNRRDRLATFHYNLGNIYSATGRHDEAEAEYRAAIPLHEENVGAHPNLGFARNHLAESRFNLGNTVMSLGRPAEAAECFRGARELWLKLVDEEPRNVGHAHNLARSYFNFAHAAGQHGLPREVEDAYGQAQQTWERLLRVFGENAEQRCDVARCYFNHGIALARVGRQEEALATLERAIPHFDRLVKAVPKEPHFAQLRQQATEYRDWLRDNQPAARATELLADAERRAVAARAKRDGKTLRQIGESLLPHLGEFKQYNRPVELERVARAAAGLIGAAAQLDSKPDTAHLEAALLFDLNIDLREFGLYDGAEEAVRGALFRWGRLHAKHPDNPLFRHWFAGAWNNLGIICADTGRLDAAEVAYRAALALREAAARANPADAENQLFHGGALCNIGNVYLDRGDLATARDFYERAVKLIEPARKKLKGNQLADQFLGNCREGLKQCAERTPIDRTRFSSATAAWAQPGPPALTFDVPDAALAAELRAADDLRLAGDPAAEQRTADLVARFPDSADVWLLRGLVLGHFCTEAGGGTIRWLDERHEEATAAFYEALVRRPDDYVAKLYKGLALRQAAHAAQASFRAIASAVEAIPEPERDGYLAPRRTRLQWDVARARESLEVAARMRPTDGRPWYELAELYRGLGYGDEAEPFLERLSAIDPGWAERVRAEIDDDEEEEQE